MNQSIWIKFWLGFFILHESLCSQEAVEEFRFKVDFALFSTWEFHQQQNFQSGFSFIPEIQYTVSDASGKRWDMLAAFKLSLAAFKLSSWGSDLDMKKILIMGEIYRLWFRFTGEQTEFRLGLQKIDFGVASLLRPLQWFNQLSYDDPLQQTPGVWGLLFRYYSLNNANFWLWGLWGNGENNELRGLDAFTTYPWYPEAGLRMQFPLPRGEMALSLHYRTASTEGTALSYLGEEKIPEIRGGWDGKWDLLIGLWVEMSLTHKFKDLEKYTDRLLINLGADYTFPWGNGYNITWENLITSYDSSPFQFSNPIYDSITVHRYPLGLFDSLSLTAQYRWVTHEHSVSFNWEHQFPASVLNVAAYYQSQLTDSLGVRFSWSYTI